MLSYLHCAINVGKQLYFTSAVIRSKRSSCCIRWSTEAQFYGHEELSVVPNKARVGERGGGGGTPENCVGVCGPLSKALTLFKTKSAIFPTLFMVCEHSQWAYCKGYSTRRQAIHTGYVVGVAFITVDFKKAFDCVNHDNLLRELHCQFGIHGSLLNRLLNELPNIKTTVNSSNRAKI